MQDPEGRFQITYDRGTGNFLLTLVEFGYRKMGMRGLPWDIPVGNGFWEVHVYT